LTVQGRVRLGANLSAQWLTDKGRLISGHKLL
jgi:hypothetical protein